MDHLKSPLSARNIRGGYKSAIIHAYNNWYEALGQNKHDFFVKLTKSLEQHGIKPYLVEGNSRTSRGLLTEAHLHIIVGGPAMYGAGILHAFPSHIWGFWYFDELGFGWNSSLRFAHYTGDNIDREQAEFFFNGVTGYALRENVSKLQQKSRVQTPLPSASAVVFCQRNNPTQPRPNYLTTEQMIDAAARHDPNAIVYVKPHPNQSKSGRLGLLDICSKHPNVEVTDASAHDLIQSARVVITQNSTTGFEALMQKKPVITCAKSDFWHATITPHTIDELRGAVENGPNIMQNFDYEGYFHWFLETHCLEPSKDNFEDRAWERVREKIMLS
jgi:hypothetical protein